MQNCLAPPGGSDGKTQYAKLPGAPDGSDGKTQYAELPGAPGGSDGKTQYAELPGAPGGSDGKTQSLRSSLNKQESSDSGYDSDPSLSSDGCSA